jgi:hypothetical protein
LRHDPEQAGERPREHDQSLLPKDIRHASIHQESLLRFDVFLLFEIGIGFVWPIFHFTNRFLSGVLTAGDFLCEAIAGSQDKGREERSWELEYRSY